jgi:hypothetical protein
MPHVAFYSRSRLSDDDVLEHLAAVSTRPPMHMRHATPQDPRPLLRPAIGRQKLVREADEGEFVTGGPSALQRAYVYVYVYGATRGVSE